MVVWLVLLTIGLPWLGGLSIWLLGDRRPAVSPALAVGFSLAAAAAALALLPLATDATVVRIPFGSVFGDLTFVPDGLGVTLAVIATLIGSLTVLFSLDYMRGEAQLGRYYALILTFIGAMAALVLTGSLLFLFVFWEITAFCSYALIAFHNDDPRAVHGGIQALIVTGVGGIGLLAGVLLAYTYIGDYQIRSFLAQAPTLPTPLLAIAAFGCLIAAAAKSAQVPFHTWLPDAMEAPTPVSALIHAATMVNAGVYLLARFAPAFASIPHWNTAVVTVGLLSALLGATMALVSNDLKRVLAYSTISQLGYMVYAVGVGALFASQFHLLNHAVFKALLFLGAGAVVHTLGTRDMGRMGGLGVQMPFVRNVFLIGALALVGLPPLNGFWSKELVLEAGLARGPLAAYLGMLLGMGLTALYTIRCVWMVFFGAPATRYDVSKALDSNVKHRQPYTEHQVHDAPPAMRFALGVLALAVTSVWLLAGPFSELLASTLPFHRLHAAALGPLILEVLASSGTWLALAVIGLSGAIWWWRGRLPQIPQLVPWVRWGIASDAGFVPINRGIVAVIQRAATALRATQTGQLNWNIAGIIGGLIVVLFVLASRI